MRTRKQKGGTHQANFLNACRFGPLKQVKELITNPQVNPAADNQKSLQLAIEGNHTGIVKLLLKDPRINPALNNQSLFKLACKYDTKDKIVRLFLSDPRIDPTLDQQAGFVIAIQFNMLDLVKLFLADPRMNPMPVFPYACATSHTDTVKLLLADPRVNPTHYDQLCLVYATNKGRTENVKILLGDPRVNPSNKDQAALKKACERGREEIVKLLLADPRVDPSVNDQEPMRLAIENSHYAVIDILKADPRVRVLPLKKWKGFTRSDIKKFDSVFEETTNNYSCCPVCLKYVSREGGCMYMNHNCKTEPGQNTVHTNLYDMYKNPGGKIYWCTICGRICMGHRHYKLGPVETKADLAPEHPGANPFSADCKTTEEGGGVKEKAQRFHALRKCALRLQKEVGKLYHQDAINQLVEAMWTAPLIPEIRRLTERNLEAKKYSIENTEFPVTQQAVIQNIARPAQNAALLPTIVESGYNAISMVDDEKVIQFHHRQKNGIVNNHAGEGEQIGTDSFANYIQSNLSDGQAGKCWLSSCTAEIHPDETQELVRLGLFPKDLQERYKDGYNRTHQVGGAKEDIFTEAKNAECVVFSKKQTRKGRRNQ